MAVSLHKVHGLSDGHDKFRDMHTNTFKTTLAERKCCLIYSVNSTVDMAVRGVFKSSGFEPPWAWQRIVADEQTPVHMTMVCACRTRAARVPHVCRTCAATCAAGKTYAFQQMLLFKKYLVKEI